MLRSTELDAASGKMRHSGDGSGPPTVAGLLEARAADDRSGSRFRWTGNLDVARGGGREPRTGAVAPEPGRRRTTSHRDTSRQRARVSVLAGRRGTRGGSGRRHQPDAPRAELARDIRFTECRMIVTDAARSRLCWTASTPGWRNHVVHQDRRGCRQATPQTAQPSRPCEPARSPQVISSCFCSHRERPVRPRRFAAPRGGWRRSVARLGDLRIRARRRLLLPDAAVPRQRDDGAVGASALRRGLYRTRRPVQRLTVHRRRSSLQGDAFHVRGQGARLRARHTRSEGRRRHAAQDRVRNRGLVPRQAEFERRFGCILVEGYGSSEGGISITRTPDTPPDALGIPAEGIAVLDPESQTEQQRAPR